MIVKPRTRIENESKWLHGPSIKSIVKIAIIIISRDGTTTIWLSNFSKKWCTTLNVL